MRKKQRGLLLFIGVGVLLASNLVFLSKVEESRQTLQEERRLYKRRTEQRDSKLAALTAKVQELEGSGDDIQNHGALHVEGAALKDSAGRTVQLRGISTHGLMWYPQYTNAGAVRTVKEHGGNVIRLALYSDQEQGYIYNPKAAREALLVALENVLSQDMYVVVDWHVLREENPNLHIDAAIELLSMVSARYGDHPGILYEICNEPGGDTDWEDICEYARRVIPAIRQSAPNAVIVVGTPKHCTDLSGPLAAPLDFDNVMYSYHQYTKTLKDGVYKDVLFDAMNRGLPVFVSEWGFSNKTTDFDDAVRIAEGFLNFLDSHQISWINWSLCNKEEGSAALLPDTQSLSGWNRQELSISGQFVFDRLKRGN